MLLLDLNVLLALIEPTHLHHSRAVGWFVANASRGWATCPLTELGFVRVMCSPAFPGRALPAEAVRLLDQLTSSPGYRFIPDDTRVVDGAFTPKRIGGTNQVTDAYLLALCRKHGLKLATLDRRIEPALAPGENIVEEI